MTRIVPTNVDYLHGIKAAKAGNYNAAIEHFNVAIDYFLYRAMWSIEDIRPVQAARLECYALLRERTKQQQIWNRSIRGAVK